MCSVCADRRTDRARRGEAIHLAARLEELARAYRDVASGKLDPHDAEFLSLSRRARMVIRRLVVDWVRP